VIRITDFSRAKQLLNRDSFWETVVASPLMRARIKEIFGKDLSLQDAVDQIIADVRLHGDQAIRDYTYRIDGISIDSLEVTRQSIAGSYNVVDEKLISALELAAQRIRDFHRSCNPRAGFYTIGQGLGQQISPLEKIGIYVPGGTAAYPSSVLMTAIPAKVAGVGEIVMVSPPSKDGSIAASTLAAAGIAGVDRVFKAGGAQAIASLAFGTQSVPRVDKICGPGNIFVTLAKKMVYGSVAVDGLQGPTELVVVADNTAEASFCAADLLAQAEHDPTAAVICITTSLELADQVTKQIEIQLQKLTRCSIASAAMDRGMMIIVNNLDEAAELVNIHAPEHLSLLVVDALSLSRKIRNAGCIFSGENSPEVLGDYVAGPSHVLPTGGSARFASPLGVQDFLKVTNVVNLNKTAMRVLGQAAVTIAKAEGLDAHAKAIEIRLGMQR